MFLYHIKPARLAGAHLVPLNELQKSHPELYTEAFRKFEVWRQV